MSDYRAGKKKRSPRDEARERERAEKKAIAQAVMDTREPTTAELERALWHKRMRDAIKGRLH